jgi:hypothetical protein
MTWLFRFLVPFILVVAGLSSARLVAVSRDVVMILLMLPTPALLLWTLAIWESREDPGHRRAIFVAAFLSFYPLFLLQALYAQVSLGFEAGLVLVVQGEVVVLSTLGVAGLAIWRYLRSPKAYMNRIRNVGRRQGRSEQAELLIEEIADRSRLYDRLASSVHSFLWKCPGREFGTPDDFRVADELVHAIPKRPSAWPARILVARFVLSIASIPILLFGGLINARYLNRTLMAISGETTWRWGEDLREIEALYAQLDTNVWRSRPLALFDGLDSLVWSWVIYDFVQHPGLLHRQRILSYGELARPWLGEFLALVQNRVELYNRLVDAFSESPRALRFHELQVRLVSRKSSQIGEKIERRAVVTKKLAPSNG